MDSGSTSPPPFVFYGPDGWLSKTSEPSETAGSTSSPTTWPLSGMWDLGSVSERTPSARATDDSESSSLLPTPLSHDAKGQAGWKNRPPDGLPDVLALLPTPRASDADRGPDLAITDRPNSGGHDLVTTVERLLPTPTATDAKGSRTSTLTKADWGPNHHGGVTLTDALAQTSESMSQPSDDGKNSPDQPPTPEMFEGV